MGFHDFYVKSTSTLNPASTFKPELENASNSFCSLYVFSVTQTSVQVFFYLVLARLEHVRHIHRILVHVWTDKLVALNFHS